MKAMLQTPSGQILCLLLAAIVSHAGNVVPATANSREAAKLVAQGDTFRKNGQLNESIWSYQQAGKLGHNLGMFRAAEMLQQQSFSVAGRERIVKLTEALNSYYTAATNRYAPACVNLAKAFQNGVGVPTNQINAYAWLKLAAQWDKSFQTDLDALVVQLNADEIQQAQALAKEYAAGQWPVNFPRPLDQIDPRLKIQGVTVNDHGRLIILNGVTLAQRDTIEIGVKQPTTGRITVTCLDIGSDYALLAVGGEPALKLLSTSHLVH